MAALYKTPAHFFNFLSLVGKNSKVVKIATYNLWAGVSPEGKVYSKLPVYKFLNSLRGKKVRILLGIPQPVCKCKKCKASYSSLLDRYRATIKHFPEFQWRFSDTSHMKLFILGSRYFIGGMNVGQSNYSDFMVETKKDLNIETFFDIVFRSSRRKL